VPGIEATPQGEELLRTLGLAGTPEQAPTATTAAERPKVDANVVAVAVMMLYEAMLTANGGNNPFLIDEEQQQGGNGRNTNPTVDQPTADRPAPSPNAAIGDKAAPRRRGRPS
jgi:hypothetical protein